MAMFADAIIDGSSYCGPVSLSCVTGIGTKSISKIVKSYYPNRYSIKGMYEHELKKVLIHLNIKYTTNKANCNLLAWTKYFQKPNKVYILQLADHYLVIKDDKIVCTQFDGKIMPLTESNYIKCQVKNYYEIKSKPKNVIIPKSEYEDMQTEKRAFHAYWKKAKALCKKYDIEIVLEPVDERVWCYLSENFIENYYAGEDPWDGEHCFYEPDTLIKTIHKDVIDKINEKNLDKVVS